MSLIAITRSVLKNPNVQSLSRNFHKSSINLLDKRWRAKNRLTINPNAFGPLVNAPDYSFKDGRPTPYGVKQMIRIDKQRQYLTKIKQLNAELDYAVERHTHLEARKAAEKQAIIDSKLKPKGFLP